LSSVVKKRKKEIVISPVVSDTARVKPMSNKFILATQYEYYLYTLDTFKQIANEGHFVVRTYSGEVLTAASNGKGQLGLGDTINRNHLVDTGLADIFDIAVGKDHTLFLTDQGEVYFVGRNRLAAQPPNGGSPVDYFISGTWNFVDDEMLYPIQVFQGFYPLDDIRSIHAGDYKSFAVDANGRVYGWGYAHYGEFGRGTYDYEVFPRVMPIPETVEAVASDAYHSLFLTVGGEVYAAGRKAYGALGNGDGILNGQIDYTSVSAPVKIPGLNNVAAITTTNLASFALHDDGTVSAWGQIPAAQCSEFPSGWFKGIQRTPVNLSQCLASTNGNTNLMDIVQIDGGDGHIIALN
jgi:alpha-tubulin suppressor-like RCC1 family protein